MRTKPSSEELHDWRGLVVTVRTWQEPASEPYDGDNPEDADGCDGWDIVVEVELKFGDQYFKTGASLGAVWVRQDYTGAAYMAEVCAEVRDEALGYLETEIKQLAAGREVKAAKLRRYWAETLLKGLT